MTDANSTILPCPTCGQQLRVPIDRGNLRLACPKCRAGWDWAASWGPVGPCHGAGTQRRVVSAGLVGALIGTLIALLTGIGISRGVCAALLGGIGGMVAWMVVGEVVLLVFKDKREWEPGSLPWKIDQDWAALGLPQRLTTWLTKMAMVVLIWSLLLFLLWCAASEDWYLGERP